MSTTATITVSTAVDVQTAATRRFLDREGIAYTVVPAETLTVTHVAEDGTTRSWSGFRPDRLRQAVADLTEVTA